jgi:hypothetical protein
MRKLLVIGSAAGALLLGGCGNATETIAEKATGAEVDVNDDGSFSVKGKDGSEYSVGRSELPRDWPTVLALPDGATITSSASSDGVATVSYDLSGGTPESAVAFHAARLEGDGYTQVMESTMGGSVLRSFEKEGESGPAANASVQAMESPTGSGVSVVVIAGAA